MSERCERTSEQTSEWPGTYVPITGSSKPPWDGEKKKKKMKWAKKNTDSRQKDGEGGKQIQ